MNRFIHGVFNAYQRALTLVTGANLNQANADDRLVFFPRRLPKPQYLAYYREYLQFLRIPIIWSTMFFFAVVQVAICYYKSKWPFVIPWLICMLSIGVLLIINIYAFWRLAHAWGFRLQILIIGVWFCVFFSTIGWGVYMAWHTMSEAYVGIMTTIFGSILGAAAPILAYSRTHYFLMVASLIGPGILFMFQQNGDFYLMMGLLFLSGFVSFVIINFMEHAKIRRLFDTRQQLSKERDRSDRLLLNILPTTIAEELKDTGRARPVRFESVTVLFTDFVGFTRISEKLTPEGVVDELDKCFSYFDQVTEKYGLEKIKTIGDSFMCAGGLPVENKTHAIDCCLAALEIQAFMNQMREIKQAQGYDYWELRLGIHTGPLVAGVVGHKKFAYDVWGDTVNTASRLESSGVPGEINISKATYATVRTWFRCEHRGKVKAKNKGDIDMYFLKGIKPKFSVHGEAKVPNAEFKSDYVRLRRKRSAKTA